MAPVSGQRQPRRRAQRRHHDHPPGRRFGHCRRSADRDDPSAARRAGSQGQPHQSVARGVLDDHPRPADAAASVGHAGRGAHRLLYAHRGRAVRLQCEQQRRGARPGPRLPAAADRRPRRASAQRRSAATCLESPGDVTGVDRGGARSSTAASAGAGHPRCTLHSRRCTPAELAAAAEQQKGRRGIVGVRNLLAITDGRAESAMESEARLFMFQHGLPRPELQHLIHGRDGECWRVDFA